MTPLILTGRLRDSYININNPANINTVYKYTARFGSSYRTRNGSGDRIPLAKYHQEGTMNMPARPVGIGDRQMDVAILDELQDYLIRGMI